MQHALSMIVLQPSRVSTDRQTDRQTNRGTASSETAGHSLAPGLVYFVNNFEVIDVCTAL